MIYRDKSKELPINSNSKQNEALISKSKRFLRSFYTTRKLELFYLKLNLWFKLILSFTKIEYIKEIKIKGVTFCMEIKLILK